MKSTIDGIMDAIVDGMMDEIVDGMMDAIVDGMMDEMMELTYMFVIGDSRDVHTYVCTVYNTVKDHSLPHFRLCLSSSLSTLLLSLQFENSYVCTYIHRQDSHQHWLKMSTFFTISMVWRIFINANLASPRKGGCACVHTYVCVHTYM